MKKLCLLLVVFACGLTASRPRLAGQSSSASFPLEEATIAQLQDWMAAGTLLSATDCRVDLKRIEEIDRRGPTLRSVIEVNPDALTIADRLDSERREKGPRGPLHGVPILIKDNIDTADRMMTTAGSLALEGSIASRDAFIVERLRAAGAVILGKTNMSEWANFRSTRSTSGWSARGGLVKNPMRWTEIRVVRARALEPRSRPTLGQSGLGTETDGSIVCPSGANGLVGIKPTLGLVSRSGIIPIAHSQDTAGPMAWTVRDAAMLLSAMEAWTPAIPSPGGAPATASTDYSKSLQPDALKGARIGVARRRTSVTATSQIASSTRRSTT
mgnify:CR=1 FL=1